MKTTLLLLAIFFVSALALPADTNDLTALLQKGLVDEQANRDLKSAIADYQSLITQFASNRQWAATAAYRQAECYRQLGQNDAAVAAYQQIIQEFGDQLDEVVKSKKSVAALGVTVDKPSSTTAPASAPAPVEAPVQSPAETQNNSSASAVSNIEDRKIRHLQATFANSPDLLRQSGKELVEAASENELRVATFLLDHGASVDRNYGPDVPLAVAASSGQKSMVELLLSRGADVNAGADGRHAALYAAAEQGYSEVVNLLLAHQADVNEDNQGHTTLEIALLNEHTNLVPALMAAGANPDFKNKNGGTPLLFLTQKGQPDAIKRLLELGAHPSIANNAGETPLFYAIKKNSETAAKLLLDAKADPDHGCSDPPLLLAVDRGETAIAELLLKAGANPNLAGSSTWGQSRLPLWCAVARHNLPLVQLLLKYQADPIESQSHLQPILFSAFSDTNILEALLAAGAPVDAREVSPSPWRMISPGWTPLIAAVNLIARSQVLTRNATEIAMARGEDVAGIRRANGLDLPPEVVEILLRHGADPNLTDSASGQTALQWTTDKYATWAPDRQVVTWLLDYKADPNHQDFDQKTLLNRIKKALSRPASKDRDELQSIAALLQQRGALDYVPNWNSIAAARLSMNLSTVAFTRQTNDWNQYTLLDLVAVELRFLTASPSDRMGGKRQFYFFWQGDQFPFPDLTRLLIHHPGAAGTNFSDQIVDLSAVLASGDASQDVPIKWGDVVEIPEADRPISQTWPWLSTNDLVNLDHCLSRHVELISGRQTNTLTLATGLEFLPKSMDPSGMPFLHTVSFWLGQVILQSKIDYATADLAHVKVTRRDPGTSKSREYLLDCSGLRVDRFPEPDLWLHDGDVIEIPQKP